MTDDEAAQQGLASGESGPNAQLEAALRATLDRHGYGFQYALLNRIGELRIPWGIESPEFPVSFRGGTTHIDFVLRLMRDTGMPVRIAAECKRANPALIDWCFVRSPLAHRGDEVALETVRVNITLGKAYGSVDLRNAWHSDRVYGLGFPIKGSAHGDKAGDNRTALDDAVAQVLRGANGLMEFLASEPTLLRHHGENGYARVVPVIFTTARLWVSDVNLSESELSTGRVPPSPLTEIDWLWLKQNISPTLKAPFLRDEQPGEYRETLRDYVVRDFARCIGVVSVSGVESFLRNSYLIGM